MISITRNDDTLVLASDDQNAENMALQEAILAAAPHLSEAFMDTPVGDDGVLRFVVHKADWEALGEVVEELSCMPDAADPEELAAIEKAVNDAVDEG